MKKQIPITKRATSFPAGASVQDSSDALTFRAATHGGFGRVLTLVDARTGTSTINGCLENGSSKSVSDPGNRTTAYTYDKMARVIKVDAPDTLDAAGDILANETHTSYYPTGQTKATWGDQTYAMLYVYD